MYLDQFHDPVKKERKKVALYHPVLKITQMHWYRFGIASFFYTLINVHYSQWVISYVAMLSVADTQKQQQKRSDCYAFHFLFFGCGISLRWLMLTPSRSWVYMPAVRVCLWTQISGRCLMSSALNTQLIEMSLPILAHCYHTGITLFWRYYSELLSTRFASHFRWPF